METRKVSVRYSDGTQKTMTVQPDQSILEAAEEHGVAIVNECQSGICGTCVAACAVGDYEMGRTEGLSDVERESRKILTCQTFPTSDCRIELQYPADDNAALLVTGQGVVTGVARVSDTTAILTVSAPEMPALTYKAGQFATVQVPGTDSWRNYSYAHPADGRNELEFIVRLLADGVMSDYLRDRAKPGDRIGLRCSKGNFYLRPVVRPVILMAGGTGLSAILAMAESLAADTAQPVRLLYGVTAVSDLCKLDELEGLERRVPGLDVQVIVARPDESWDGKVGVVTDLLDEEMLVGRRCRCLPVRSGGHGRSHPNLVGEQRLPSRRPVLREVRSEWRCAQAETASGGLRRPRHGRYPRARPRDRGGDRRKHRGHCRGQGAPRVVRPGHRAGEGRTPPPSGGQTRRSTGLASTPSTHRGTDRTGTDLSRNRRRYGARGCIQGRHGGPIPDPVGWHVEEAGHQ